MPWEKKFDRDEALGRAEATFWQNGYQGTSLETLLDCMGIQKGSFYATFGSKRAALMESLDRYIQERFTSFEKMADGNPPLRTLSLHLDAVYRESRGDRPDAGCFLLNISLELAPTDFEIRDLVQKTLRAQEAYYTKLLRAAVHRQDLPDGFDVTGVSRAILAMVLGMRVMARSAAPQATIRAVRDQAIALFERSDGFV